jgi:NifU-like protein involved in Fe-S cluster formation
MSSIGPYNNEVRRRFENPVHAGDLEGSYDQIWEAEVSESPYGARLVLYAGISDGKIASLRFRAKGCPYLIAAAERFCGHYEGAEPSQLAEVSIAGLIDDLDVPVARTGRMLLIEDAAKGLRRINGEKSPGH